MQCFCIQFLIYFLMTAFALVDNPKLSITFCLINIQLPYLPFLFFFKKIKFFMKFCKI